MINDVIVTKENVQKTNKYIHFQWLDSEPMTSWMRGINSDYNKPRRQDADGG